MSNLDPTPTTGRRNVIFNLVMFTLTSLVTLVYSWTFVEHVARGLETSLTDELCEFQAESLSVVGFGMYRQADDRSFVLLVGCAIISSSIFYGRSLVQSYKAYVRTYGPSFSIGPFTILNTSLLPSSSTTSMVAPSPTPMISQRQGTFSPAQGYSPKLMMRDEDDLDLDVDVEMNTPGMMFDTPRHSMDFALCPPTPESMASNQTPMLVTPSMDAVGGRSVMMDSTSSSSSSTPSRAPSRAGQSKKFRLGGAAAAAGGGQGGWEDMEKGEMFGLGMGEIGGRGMEMDDESRTVRP